MALKLDITMSLDGYIAGPNQTLENPLGEGADGLHAWLFNLAAFREAHGMEGGEDTPDSAVLEEAMGAGAVIMGRRMFSGGSGGWEDDPRADGWWGDEPPFHAPVFVLTHHAREPRVMEGGTTFHFVTDGIESALEQARAAAGDADISLAGGADVVQQALRAGLVDDIHVHVAPLLLGGGVRLFDTLDTRPDQLVRVRVIDSPAVTHLRFQPA